MTFPYREDAPFRRDTRTPEVDGYQAGYATGLTWKDTYRPCGPYVPKKESLERDQDWITYYQKTEEIHRQYMIGFDDGLAAQRRGVR